MKTEERLSDLPENLIHHIMSFLPRKETGKFCVLSKTLSSVWLSFPALHLDSTVRRDCREDAFLDNTRASLRRRRAHSKPFHSLSFNLYVYRANGCGFSTVLDSAAEVLEDLASFALDKSVSRLSLCCRGDTNDFNYNPLFVQYGTPRSFSSAVFSSRTIREIYLGGLNFASSVLTVSCPLIEDFALSACSGMKSVEFSSAAKLLKSIEIYKCHGFERIRVMDGLVSLRSFSYTGFSTERCELDIGLTSRESLEFLELSQNPGITGKWLQDNVAELASLETFILDSCENVRDVRVENQSLKCLKLSYCESLANIDVAAPDLECFQYSASLVGCGEPKCCEINIGGCTRLKTLKMTGAAVSRKWIEDNLAPGLSFLEDLKLDSCDFASDNTVKTRFRFENLTSFQLVSPRSLAWLEIECPNLASFKYSGEVIPLTPVVISSSLKNAEIEFDSKYFHESRKDFQRHLKNLISFSSRCNTLFLQVRNSKDNLIIREQVRKDLIHPKNELKHLQIPLVCLEKTENVVDFVDSLLWLAHHPETISFVDTSYFIPKPKSLIKLYFRHGDASEVREDGEDGFTCCSSSRYVKCWRHDLTEIVLENFGDRHAEILQGYFSENTKARISVVS